MDKILLIIFSSIVTTLLGFFVWQLKRLVSSIDGLKATIQEAKTDIATQKTTCSFNHKSIDDKLAKIEFKFPKIFDVLHENSSDIKLLKERTKDL